MQGKPAACASRSVLATPLSPPSLVSSCRTGLHNLQRQPGKLKPKDLKEAIRKARAERQREIDEQKVLRALLSDQEDLDDNRARSPSGTGGASDSLRNPPVGATTAAGKETRDESIAVGNEPNGIRQPAQLSVRALCAFEKTALGTPGGVGNYAGDDGAGASKQAKELAFLRDLAEIEAGERERSFKV